MSSFLLVFLGGGVGACLRYALSLLPRTGDFPLWTLAANLLGAVLIGFLAGLGERSRLPEKAALLLKTGLCGGFTTFSTFSLEALTLARGGNDRLCAIYIFCSLAGCLAGVYLGSLLAGVRYTK